LSRPTKSWSARSPCATAPVPSTVPTTPPVDRRVTVGIHFEAKRFTNPPLFPAERHDHLSAVSRGRSAPGNHIILDDIRAWLT